MTCTNCGSPLDQGAVFCGNCGRPIGQVAQQPPGAAGAHPNAPQAPPPPSPTSQPQPAVPAAPQAVAPAAAWASGASVPPAAPVQHSGSAGKATASMVLGIIGMVAWIVPLVGVPVTTLALVFGISNRHSARRGQAIAGIVLACISIPLIIFSGYVGYLDAMQQRAQNPTINTQK